MIDLINEARQKRLQLLYELIDQLKKLELPTKFESLTIISSQICDRESVLSFAENLPVAGKHIYYFKVDDDERLLDGYKQHERSADYKYAKRNKEIERSKFVYVGSCGVMKLRDRFVQHCGWKDAGTYSLQLKDWLKETNVTFTFAYAHLDTSQVVLQQMEDSLRSIVYPLFGKSGANNKAKD